MMLYIKNKKKQRVTVMMVYGLSLKNKKEQVWNVA